MHHVFTFMSPSTWIWLELTVGPNQTHVGVSSAAGDGSGDSESEISRKEGDESDLRDKEPFHPPELPEALSAISRFAKAVRQSWSTITETDALKREGWLHSEILQTLSMENKFLNQNL